MRAEPHAYKCWRIQVGGTSGLLDNHLPRAASEPVCLRVHAHVGMWHSSAFLQSSAWKSPSPNPEESKQPSPGLLSQGTQEILLSDSWSLFKAHSYASHPTQRVLRIPTCIFGKPFTSKHYPQYSHQLLFEEGTRPFRHTFL